jgi:peptide/nickel transport system ATP-binding protein/oligopeptide transport system ATP-binding protein
MGEKLLEVKNLKTEFDTKRGPLKAVDGVSYDVLRGEIVALVGESGCGKTVSALSMIRLIPEPPGKVTGEAWLEGEDLLKLNREAIRSVRGRKISVIFQEPMTSLNPVFTIGKQLGEGMEAHRTIEKKQMAAQEVKLLQTVGIPGGEQRLGQYPFQFSGGMRQRVMIAMALSCGPSLIIADEPTTAVDVTIQAQLLELLNAVIKQANAAVLLITHNLGMVAKYAKRVNVMYAGRIVEKGLVDEIFYNPLHPYTKALLGCVPRLDETKGCRLVTIDGQPPDLVKLPPGCSFSPRCGVKTKECEAEWPPLHDAGNGHMVACIH